jgi:hypothetical protein
MLLHPSASQEVLASTLMCCHPCCSVNEAEVKHRQAECQEPSMLCCCLPQVNEYQGLQEWNDPCKVAISERSAASSNGKAVYEVSYGLAH